MSVLFIDTNCELNYKTAKKVGLDNVIRMPYTICGKEFFYDLGENYDAKKFFTEVRKGNLPITSCLNTQNYIDYFEPFFKAGEDILYISFSSEMSGTFEYLDKAVEILSKKYPNAKYRRFDTKAISLAAGVPVYLAGKMHMEGKTNDEIVEFLDKFIYRMNAIFSPDDLFYLRKGGRINAAQATMGTILQLKPIIRLNDEGKLEARQKIMGRNKAIKYIIDDVVKNVSDTDKYPIVILHADCVNDAEKIENGLRRSFPEAELWIYDVGPVIGAHCGPDTIACVYVGNKRNMG